MCCKHPLALGDMEFCRSYCAMAWVCTAVCNHLPNCIASGLQAVSCVFPGAATAFRWRSSG
jgi:hypothetical protein